MIDLRRVRVGTSVPALGVVLAFVLTGLAACASPAQPVGTAPTSGSSLAGSPSATSTATPSSPRPSAPGPQPGTPGPSTGIAVTGTVLSSPGCPGPALAESPCPDRPVAGARVELSRGGTVMATTKTDNAGRFEMRVPPGDYVVSAFNVGLASHASQSITVAGPVTVRLVVDSGLR